MALSIPDVSCELSYGTDSWAAPAYVEENARLRSFNCKRGRQHELQRFDAGTSELRFLNVDRALDPTWMAGPHAGNLVPGLRYRLRATWAGITYPLCVHFAERLKPEWPDAPLSDLVLTGVDAFKKLRKKRITSTGYVDVVTADAPRAFYRLGESPGSAIARDSSGNARDGRYNGTTKLGAEALLVADADTALDTNGTKSWVEPPSTAAPTGTGAFAVELWFKTTTDDATANAHHLYIQHVMAGASPIIVHVDGDGMLWASINDVPLWAGVGPYNNGLPHHVVFTRDGAGNYKLYVDAVLVQSGAFAASNVASSQSAIGGTNWLGSTFDGVIDEVALYSVELTAARVSAHYAQGRGAWAGQLSGQRINQVLDTVGWPAGDRLVDTGNSSLQGVTGSLSQAGALDHMQLVEASESGLLFQDGQGRIVFRSRQAQLVPPWTAVQATFGDGPGQIPYEGSPDMWMGDDDVNPEAIVTRQNFGSQRAINQAAEARYGPSTLTRDTVLDSDGPALDLATWLVAHYALPTTRIGTIRIHPIDDPATIWPIVLGLEIGHRVVVEGRPVPKTSAAWSRQAIVEGIKHDKTEDGDWFVDLSLGAADFADYWILGTSALGTNTRLAF